MKKILSLIIAFAMIISMSSVALAAEPVAKVGDNTFEDIQEAIKAAAPAGTVELLKNVTVDKWVMFAESLTIGTDQLITLVIDGLTINGNGYELTVNSVESASNGNCLFFDATKLNINDLIINLPDAANGIGLKSGTLKNVTFNGGQNGVYPQSGDITIDGCTFATKGDVLYFEQERDGLTITGCTFNQLADKNVVLLRGDVKFTNNIINSGRTVNVVSGSPVVTGNNFNDVRLKVYNDAEATISNNKINNLAFDDEDGAINSTFTDNTLSEASEKSLADVGATNKVTAPAPKPASGSGISVKYNGGNSFITSKSDVPTGVEIDGVPVAFSGNGSSFTVSGIPADAKWVTVRWNSTSVTTNFTPSGAYVAEVNIPKTGDMPIWAAVLALFGF